jgi:hypothetical protein
VQRSFVVVDNFIPRELAARLRADAMMLRRQGVLHLRALCLDTALRCAGFRSRMLFREGHKMLD